MNVRSRPTMATARRYRIERYLTEGGMGAIYLGKKLGPGGFEKEVVLKQLLPEYTARPEFRDLFFREAKISATLDHANIVHVFDLVQSDESLFIVMEYVRGADLRTIGRRARLRRHELSPAATIHIVLEVLAGLGYAHARKDAKGGALDIIHRDVSPSNVLCSAQGEVKLSDFGIAKAATHSSVFYRVRGKVGYMSPEQARNESIDHRTDLYSLAVCLWEALAGERLFIGDLTTPPDQIYGQPLPPISQKRAGLPAALDVVLAKALAKDVADRYQSAGEMAEALRRVAQRYGLLFSAPELADHLRLILGPDPERWLKEEVSATEAPRTQKLPAQSSGSLEGKEAESLGIVEDDSPQDVLSPKVVGSRAPTSSVPVAEDDEEVTRMRNPPMPMKAAPPPKSPIREEDVVTPPPQKSSLPPRTTGNLPVRSTLSSPAQPAAPKVPPVPPPAAVKRPTPVRTAPPPPPPSLGDPPTPPPPLRASTTLPPPGFAPGAPLPRPNLPSAEIEELPPTPPPAFAQQIAQRAPQMPSPAGQTMAWPPAPSGLPEGRPRPPAPTLGYGQSPQAPSSWTQAPHQASDDFFPQLTPPGVPESHAYRDTSGRAYSQAAPAQGYGDMVPSAPPSQTYPPTGGHGVDPYQQAPAFSHPIPNQPAFAQPYGAGAPRSSYPSYPSVPVAEPFVDHGPTPAVVRRGGPPAWLTLLVMLGAASGGAYLAHRLTQPTLSSTLDTPAATAAGPSAGKMAP